MLELQAKRFLDRDHGQSGTRTRSKAPGTMVIEVPPAGGSSFAIEPPALPSARRSLVYEKRAGGALQGELRAASLECL